MSNTIPNWVKTYPVKSGNARVGTCVRLKKDCIGIPAGATGIIVSIRGTAPKHNQSTYSHDLDLKVWVKWDDPKHEERNSFHKYVKGLLHQDFFWISTKLEAFGHNDIPNDISYMID